MQRRQLRLFASAILTSFILLGTVASSAFALPEKFFGMTAHESMNESAPDWHTLQKAGVQRFRMQINWSKVISAGNWREAGAWELTYDKYFKEAATHGIEVLPYIYGRKNGTSTYYLKSETNNYKEWLEFVELFTARYGQGGSFWVYNPSIPQFPVKTWEVWNEPNLAANSPGGVRNGKTYGEFLVGTAAAIRAHQQGWSPKILFGGIYMEYFQGPSIVSYLQEAAQASGISTAYDGLSVHPYAYGQEHEIVEGKEVVRSFSEKAYGFQANIGAAASAQGVAKLPTKPLWVTEVGWPVDGTGAQHVTPSEQAGLLNETYNWLKANWTTYNVQYAAWFLYKDVPNQSAWDWHSGLRTATGAWRPSWWAYEAQTGVSPWPGAQMAFQANTTQLFSYSTGTGPANLGLGMAAGTSPSVATLVNGESAMAFQANTSTLWSRLGSGAYGNTGLGMAAGTSPSVAPLLGGNEEEYVMAFQANTGTLWKRLSSGTYANTELGMAAGTSPSVATLTNGEYVIAFQTNTGALWTRSSSGATVNWGSVIKAGTSPSIAGLANGGYEIAYQDTAGNLNSNGTSGHVNWEQGMAAGTSPSITGVPGNGYQMAFQANTGSLISIGSLGGMNWGQGMAAGTSPSITALPAGGYEMAFQANTGELIGIGTAGSTSTGQGMAGGTSPSISPPSRWAS
jgi:hypothetical protein